MNAVRFSLILLALSLSSTCVAQKRPSPGDTLIVKNDGKQLKVEPGAFADVILELSEGDTLIMSAHEEKPRNYYPVRYGESEGWVFAGNIADLKYARRIAREKAQREREQREQRRREREREREREDWLRGLLEDGLGLSMISASYTTNSADGVTWSVTLINIDPEKRIKYITFGLQAFNSVGDPAPGRITGKSKRNLRGVGPIDPGKAASFSFDNAWYNGTVSCIELQRIDVEHFDGTTFTYVNDLARIDDFAVGSIPLRGECQDV